MFLSVIVPCYNVEKEILQRCILSVLNQEYIHRITFHIQVEYHGMYDRLDILRRQHFIYFCQHYQKKRMLKFQ